MAHTISPEEYAALGRQYYKQKLYIKAIDAFTTGIEVATTPRVGLWDARAACWEKMGEFGKAVRDGREMIRLERGGVKGYLRTGSALEKMGKLETARGIYEYGMKNVSVGDRNFKLLQQLHDKLTRKLSPPTAIDPFTILPVELVEMVITYLTFRNMVNCLRVCKSWKNYLIKRPNLWLDLDLSSARRDVRRTFVRDAVRRADYQIRRATIHRFPHTDVLRNLATACKNLTHLEFLSGNVMNDSLIEIVQCATNLKKLVYNITVTSDCISQVLRHRRTLEHAEFQAVSMPREIPTWQGPFPNLQTLILTINGTGGVSMSPDTLLLQCPVLHTLRVTNAGRAFIGTDNYTHLPFRHLELTNCSLDRFPDLPETLVSLTLKPDSQFDTLAPVFTTHAYMPLLTHLSIANLSGLVPTFFARLLDAKKRDDQQPITEFHDMTEEDYLEASKLESLAIRGCTLFNPQPSNRLCNSLRYPRILSPALHDLDFGTQDISDDDVEDIVERCKGLRNVNLSTTNITGAGVKMLVDACPELERLNVDGCSKISNRDAIAYAESKGVRVSWKMESFGSGRNGSRRVRYG